MFSKGHRGSYYWGEGETYCLVTEGQQLLPYWNKHIQSYERLEEERKNVVGKYPILTFSLQLY